MAATTAPLEAETPDPAAVAGASAWGSALDRYALGELATMNVKLGREKIVVTYGGAMHNDIAPAPDRATFSFRPDLSAKVGGRTSS